MKFTCGGLVAGLPLLFRASHLLRIDPAGGAGGFCVLGTFGALWGLSQVIAPLRFSGHWGWFWYFARCRNPSPQTLVLQGSQGQGHRIPKTRGPAHSSYRTWACRPGTVVGAWSLSLNFARSDVRLGA